LSYLEINGQVSFIKKKKVEEVTSWMLVNNLNFT
jgi:hypothetical protein